MSLLIERISSAPAVQTRRLPRVARLTLAVLLVSAGYYAGGVVALTLRFPPSGISIIWLPNAILLAALLLARPATWHWYLLAALPTHLHLASNFQPGVPVTIMLIQFAGNAGQALVAALLVRHFAGSRPRFDSLRSVTIFIVLAALATPAVVSALIAHSFVLTGWAADFWLAFRQRFLNNVVATLTVTPLIVLTAARGIAWLRTAPAGRQAELGLLVVALIVVGLPVFGGWQPGPENLPALLYAPLPLLLWAAVRFGPGGASLSLLFMALMSLSNAYAGRGPFSVPSPAENVLSLQIFLIAIAVQLMFLAALVEERRRTRESLRKVQADLTHAARVTAMGQLVASIAHEINQPLTVIVLNAQASLRQIGNGTCEPQDFREVLQDIVDAGQRASKVIERTRGLVKKGPTQHVPLNLNELIQEVIALVHGELTRHHVSLRIELVNDLPAVPGDRVQVQQVLINLIMNSIEAMRDVDVRSRELIVQSRRDGAGFVVVAVRDVGPGLDQGDPDVIFNPFYTTKADGMGMGLSVSRSIVDAHGGRLWATSHDSGGATFQFSLPTA